MKSVLEEACGLYGREHR